MCFSLGSLDGFVILCIKWLLHNGHSSSLYIKKQSHGGLLWFIHPLFQIPRIDHFLTLIIKLKYLNESWIHPCSWWEMNSTASVFLLPNYFLLGGGAVAMATTHLHQHQHLSVTSHRDALIIKQWFLFIYSTCSLSLSRLVDHPGGRQRSGKDVSTGSVWSREVYPWIVFCNGGNRIYGNSPIIQYLHYQSKAFEQ